jgi:amino-acid N-acetyltransferase
MKAAVRKATPADARGIHDILLPYVEEGIILRRSVEEITQHIGSFFVAEIDGEIAGVVAYYRYGSHLKEIRSLAVKSSSKGKGLGKLLIDALLEEITRIKPQPKIFTLTYIPDFFKKFGFHEVPKETLPEKIWKDCSICPKADQCGETALVYGKK